MSKKIVSGYDFTMVWPRNDSNDYSHVSGDHL